MGYVGGEGENDVWAYGARARERYDPFGYGSSEGDGGGCARVAD